jgi:hypothetical protein
MDKLTTNLQGQQKSAQQASIDVKEAASQAQFQATQAADQAKNAPRVALGPVPSGPFADISQWSAAFLQYLGGGDNHLVTDSNMAMIMGWAQATGLGLEGNNPLGVTLAAPGSEQTKGGPNPSPQKYANASDGMLTAAQTLANFPLIMEAIQSGSAESVLGTKPVQDELGQWSNGSFRDISKQAQAAEGQAKAGVQKYAPPKATAPPSEMTRGQAPGYMGPLAANQPPGTVPAPNPLPGEATRSQAPNFMGPLAASQPPGTSPVTVIDQGPGGVPMFSSASLTGAAAGGPAQPVAVTPPGGNAAGNLISPQTLGGQQPVAPGTTYIPGTTLTDVGAASPESAAFQAATTGANRIPYLGYQYLQAFNAIMQMVHANTTQGA